MSKEKMKIASIYSLSFDPRSSQSDSALIWIYNVINRLGPYHDIVVYSPKDYGQEETEYFNGVKYRRTSAGLDYWLAKTIQGLSKKLHGFNYARRKRPFFASVLNNFIFILKVSRDLRREKCDIVHIHEDSQFIDIIRAFNPKTRIVLHMHSELLTQLDHNMIERRLKKADLILGCSDYLTEKIRQSFPSLAERCQTLYNGVDLTAFTYDTKKNVGRVESKQLLFVSKVSPEKGLHVLVDAFKEVAAKYPNVHLSIVGTLNAWPLELFIWLSEDPNMQKLASFHRKGLSNPYFDYLNQKLLSMNLSDKVTFYGKIDHELIAKFYQSADVFVQPSFTEAFGMGIIEAMACQVPVVGTRIGGIPEIIDDGKNGFLVNPGDSCEMAKAIIKLLSNDDLRQKMGEAGRKRVESFSWDNVVSDLLCLYKDMYERV